MADDIVFVAVGKEVEKRHTTLKWALKKALQNKSPSICVFYVLVPAQMITLPNGFTAPENSVKKDEVESFRERERQEGLQILYDCGSMCNAYEVPFETIQIQKESIAEGILEFVYQLRILKLVMGAGPDTKYSRKMLRPMSKKATYVLRGAPDFCHLWFVCDNLQILKREGRPRQLTENPERNQSDSFNCSELLPYSPPPAWAASAEGSSSRSPIMYHDPSPTRTMTPAVIDKLYAELEQALKESKESSQKLHREVKQRQKAEKEVSETNLELEAAEKVLLETVEELQDTKTQLNKALDELSNASTQLVSFEGQIEELNLKVKQMEKKLESSRNQQKMKQKLRDGLQKKYNLSYGSWKVRGLAQGSRNHTTQEYQSSDIPIFPSEYSLVDLKEATNFFDPSLKIGEGGYGDVYRGFLDHTDVAIEIVNPHSLQGPSEFNQEVDVLSKLHHPNLVTLIGTCNESRGLIYEYLPNGTLEDRLNCKNNSPPLTWQTRIQIVIELCSVLNFLHSRKPNRIIHADLNPKNVFLDANFTCKLSGFGFCHVISNDEVGINETREVSPKTDVFSFGIVLLSLLTAECSSDIARKVRFALETDDLYNILDDSAGQWPFVRATQLAHLALKCCHIFSDDRPDLASEVWMVLKPDIDPSQGLPKPLRRIKEDQIPPYFICPILQEIMQDPHFAADGFTYEADAIRAWFEGGHETSPMTNLRLENLHLTPNHALHSAIQEWRQKYLCIV